MNNGSRYKIRKAIFSRSAASILTGLNRYPLKVASRISKQQPADDDQSDATNDEYQSKENAKHVLLALKENARQGFWNGSLPPIGYRIVAAEQRGAKVKKKLEIDPLHADTIRLIYRLALEGDGTSGPMGVKNITVHLNRHRLPSPATADAGALGRFHRIPDAAYLYR